MALLTAHLPETRSQHCVPSGRRRRSLALLLFLIYLFIFNDSCQTNYFRIYRTDLRQIVTVGRMVDDQSKTNVSIPHGTLPWQANSNFPVREQN